MSKSQLQIIQEKRGAYTRKRTKMFSHMTRTEIFARHNRPTPTKKVLPKITGMKVGVEKKLTWLARLFNWVKGLWGEKVIPSFH